MEERRAAANGIWLCQTCGRLIDVDPAAFTVGRLAEWKREAQAQAFHALTAPTAAARREVERISSLVADDRCRDVDDGGRRLDRILAAAAAILDGTDRIGGRAPSVESTLRLQDGSGAATFGIGRLPPVLSVASDITIVAPPGMGKTTALLQLARHVLAGKTTVPLYVRLGDWATGEVGLLESLTLRPAFRAIATDELLELGEKGGLLLLLDGWNELGPRARIRLRVELDRLRCDLPRIRIVATTRNQALDVPLPGPRVALEPLSEDQQLELARTGFGERGTRILDEAWRTPGVRELVAVPLYLVALLTCGTTHAGPTTKEAALRLFVGQHEGAHVHAEAILDVLKGRHVAILRALATHLNENGDTSMTEADARRIVSEASARLRDGGQIRDLPEPGLALEVLVERHALTRSGDAVSFQHQLIQEWYASLSVIDLMRAAEVGDVDARLRLRAAILDRPVWEESVLFAVERLSREGAVPPVAGAVRLALPIDPMLAAEMVHRATPAVWDAVAGEIRTFVSRWHAPGTVDRAARFMIITGRSEFATLIWPLAASPDPQVRIAALRTAPRFRPSVLGPDPGRRVAALPTEVRSTLLSLIAAESGIDGMDLAVDLAKLDPEATVQVDVVEQLQFRRADRHVVGAAAPPADAASGRRMGGEARRRDRGRGLSDQGHARGLHAR